MVDKNEEVAFFNLKAVWLNHALKVWRMVAKKEEIAVGNISIIHLVEAVENAVVDLKRMADFHQPPGKLPDRHKHAGFLAKWIAKTRPIQLPTAEPVNLRSKVFLEINARYAFYIFDSFLSNMTPLDIALHIIYWFSFRDERGETLAMVAHCVEAIKSEEAPAKG